MHIYPLVFSNKKDYRIARHSLFWLMWIAYYTTVTTFALSNKTPLSHRFLFSLSEVSLTTPMDMIFIYSIIYFLIPKLLFKGRYLSMIFLWLLFSIIFILVFEIFTAQLDPVLRRSFNIPIYKSPGNYFWLSFSLFSQINMEGCLAAAIKLGKISFINQKEVELLKDEKIKILSERDATGVQPVFLADIIQRVEDMKPQNGNIKHVLKKIRTVMNGIMYENTNAKISLCKELELVREYIDLEQLTRKEVIDIDLSLSEINCSENIASFILLTCVQNAFIQLSDMEINNKKLSIDINADNNILRLLMSWNKPCYTSSLNNGKNIFFVNLNNRLRLIYPQSHEFKVVIEPEKIAVFMKIDLRTAIN